MAESPTALSPGGAAWVGALDGACDAIGGLLRAMAPDERRRPVGRGAGGDITVRADAVAEDALLAALEPVATALGGAVLIAEERGRMPLGEGGDPEAIVVVDPIDGSLNAKRGLPFFSTAVAVADGPGMGDVWLGYVRDHGSGATYVGERGRGAWRDGAPLAVDPTTPARVVAFEGASPRRLAAACEPLQGHIHRVRAMGSLALSLCSVAAGYCEGMAGLTRARSVDTAGAQLICREAGAVVGMPDPGDLAATPLDIDARHAIVAANSIGTLGLMARAREAAGAAAGVS